MTKWNSISGSTEPLVVLDGVIYRGNISDINPSDIASIDVLKDASSTAIYGSQAANGVLMITTKTVKSVSKPILEYSGSFTLQGLINNDMKRLDRDGFATQVADIKLAESRMGTDMLQRNPDFNQNALVMPALARSIHGLCRAKFRTWRCIPESTFLNQVAK